MLFNFQRLWLSCGTWNLNQISQIFLLIVLKLTTRKTGMFGKCLEDMLRMFTIFAGLPTTLNSFLAQWITLPFCGMFPKVNFFVYNISFRTASYLNSNLYRQSKCDFLWTQRFCSRSGLGSQEPVCCYTFQRQELQGLFTQDKESCTEHASGLFII